MTLNLRTGTETERVGALAVTANFFEFVGIPVALGRSFTGAEATPERHPRVAVLSDPFWRRRFNADPAVIGRELTINGESARQNETRESITVWRAAIDRYQMCKALLIDSVERASLILTVRN